VRLDPQKLRQHLAKGPASLYLLSGDETLLVEETLDQLRSAARDTGCEERKALVAERNFDWRAFQASLGNLSLFSARQLLELRLPTGKPGELGARVLAEIAAAPPPDKLLVIVTPALRSAAARAKWVRALADGGVWVALQAPRPEQLPAWLAARLRAAGLACEPEALQLLAERVEGNLLAAKQEIDKLTLLAPDGRVTAAAVRAAVGDGARYDVFQLADAALAGEAPRTARIIRQLEDEGVAPTLVLWSLVRDIMVLADLRQRLAQGAAPGAAMQAAGVWRSREGLFRKALARLDQGHTARLLARAAAADRVVKAAAAGRPWNALLELAVELAAEPA